MKYLLKVLLVKLLFHKSRIEKFTMAMQPINSYSFEQLQYIKHGLLKYFFQLTENTPSKKINKELTLTVRLLHSIELELQNKLKAVA